MEKQLETMRKLGFTDEEIQDILKSDKAIDKGEKLFELPKELEAGAKKARQAERKKPSEPVKREQKIDSDKQEIIQKISSLFENPLIINPSREIEIVYNNRIGTQSVTEGKEQNEKVIQTCSGSDAGAWHGSMRKL